LGDVVKCTVSVSLRTPLKRPIEDRRLEASSKISEEREFQFHVAPVLLDGLATEHARQTAMLSRANKCLEQHRSAIRYCVLALKEK
jgi:hypothetical protein